MTKKPIKPDILDKPIWEIPDRWRLNNFDDTETREANLRDWAYHALPIMVKQRIRSIDWIVNSNSYSESLEKLHLIISTIDHQGIESHQLPLFRQQIRQALAEILKLQEYLDNLDQSLDNNDQLR